MNFLKKQLIYIVLILLVLADLSYSCYQYSNSYIDGDFSGIVLAVPPYDKVLEDPLGISIFNGETYAATNRFTAHAVMAGYFRTVPFLLQNIFSPIDSVYISIIAAKLMIHALLLLLVSYYVAAWNGFKWKYILISYILIAPLFQTEGSYFMHMAAIDLCITYTMYYALPMIFLLLFYLPFYRFFVTGYISNRKVFTISWILFSLILAFFGPLTSPIILVANLIIFVYLTIKGQFRINEANLLKKLWYTVKTINSTVFTILLFAGLFSLYSMYVGTKNTENGVPISLNERYTLLFKGINEVFFSIESGIIYIFVATIITLASSYILYRKEYSRYFNLVFLLLVFSVIYIFLLPLGGYRIYRPVILRRDTHLPILVIIYFYWSTSSILLLKKLTGIKKAFPFALAAIIIIFYTKADFSLKNKFYNPMEKECISDVAKSTEDCILLEPNFPIAQWQFNTECEKSENAATLLEFYNITPRKIYFHYPPEQK